MTSFDELRDLYGHLVPFNTHLGIEVIDIGPGTAVTRLPDDPRLLNHVGTQHAAALFAVAEAASGAAVVGMFGDELRAATPLARKAEISYRRPAIGPITASASITEDVGAVVDKFKATGRASFDVAVQLTDENDKRVAEMAVAWLVRTRQDIP
ncbi:MAG: DUF4442 domain-containing protein [Actinomycetota bacterium]|nr:DUF4442 domain-containing protein [Actinomycetota bacterium]